MLPACLDDYVTEDIPVRAVEPFIDEPDLCAHVSNVFSQRRPSRQQHREQDRSHAPTHQRRDPQEVGQPNAAQLARCAG
jgi:hypothetical protein